jgi:hypothetical protein
MQFINHQSHHLVNATLLKTKQRHRVVMHMTTMGIWIWVITCPQLLSTRPFLSIDPFFFIRSTSARPSSDPCNLSLIAGFEIFPWSIFILHASSSCLASSSENVLLPWHFKSRIQSSVLIFLNRPKERDHSSKPPNENNDPEESEEKCSEQADSEKAVDLYPNSDEIY